jgi:hypothetical protein
MFDEKVGIFAGSPADVFAGKNNPTCNFAGSVLELLHYRTGGRELPLFPIEFVPVAVL